VSDLRDRIAQALYADVAGGSSGSEIDAMMNAICYAQADAVLAELGPIHEGYASTSAAWAGQRVRVYLDTAPVEWAGYRVAAILLDEEA
jgi:hypothetical protein